MSRDKNRAPDQLARDERCEPAVDYVEAEHDPAASRRASNVAMQRMLGPYVQRKPSGPANASAEATHAAAAQGTESPARPLPHADRIQAAFGPDHDVSKIRAHIDPGSAKAMGAEAYATGNDVVFAKEPDVATAAHEAAHVVQQAQGVNLKGGVGQAGDTHEQNADAVADRVAARQSAAPLLAGYAPLKGESHAAQVQRKEATDTGASTNMNAQTPEAPVRNPFEQEQHPKNQSRANETAFEFDPPTLSFQGAGAEQVTIRNKSSTPQTIDGWRLAGDSSAFHTSFVGERSVVVQPGASVTFRVNFVSEQDMPQAAELVVDSMFGDAPARLKIIGVKRGEAAQAGCSQTPISATSPEGRHNSIGSAMPSVGAAWTSVMTQQKQGVTNVSGRLAVPPKPAAAWETVLDGILAQGLSKAIGGISLYLGGGLALATWNVIERLGLNRGEGEAAAKQVASLTLSVHKQITASYSTAVLGKTAAAVRTAIEAGKQPTIAMRDAFFNGQTLALTAAFQDAITTLNNSEGDFAAMEAERPGLGFAALEAYRDHLSRHEGDVIGLQASSTAGMWMAFLAQQDLGVHDPETWEQATPGAAVEKNLYNSTDAHHRMRQLARGVLEVNVVWDYDRMRTNPILSIEHARTSGVPDEFKSLLTEAPLGHFPMPIIVHGKVKKDTLGERRGTGHLRIARNEGGAISLGAEEGADGAEMLELLGNGDAYAGARSLFGHIDEVTLAKVD